MGETRPESQMALLRSIYLKALHTRLEKELVGGGGFFKGSLRVLTGTVSDREILGVDSYIYCRILKGSARKTIYRRVSVDAWNGDCLRGFRQYFELIYFLVGATRRRVFARFLF